MRPNLWILVTVLLAVSCREQRVQYPKLDELDGYIAARPVYETRKRDQLEGIRKLAAGPRAPVACAITPCMRRKSIFHIISTPRRSA